MEVDETIDELRKQMSEWVPVERPGLRAATCVEVCEITDRSAPPSIREEPRPTRSRSRSAIRRSGRSCRSPCPGPVGRPGDDLQRRHEHAAGRGGRRPRSTSRSSGSRSTRSRSATCRRSTTRSPTKVNPEFADLRRAARGGDRPAAPAEGRAAPRGAPPGPARPAPRAPSARAAPGGRAPGGRGDGAGLRREPGAPRRRRREGRDRLEPGGRGHAADGREAGARAAAARRRRRRPSRSPSREEEFERTLAMLARAQGLDPGAAPQAGRGRPSGHAALAAAAREDDPSPARESRQPRRPPAPPAATARPKKLKERRQAC